VDPNQEDLVIFSGEKLHATSLPLNETFPASTCKKSCKFLEGKSKHKKTEKRTDPGLFCLVLQGGGTWKQDLCQPQAVMAF